MKKFVSVVLLLALVLGICSCGPKKGDASKITVSHCQGEWCWPILDELAEKFKAETGTEVEFIYVAGDSYGQWQEAQLAAGSEPDIIWGMTDPKVFYESKKIMPLTKYYEQKSPFSNQTWKDDYIDGILDNCYDANGKELISNTICQVQMNLYYNKDILSELNLEVPQSWTDFIEASKVIKEAGYIPYSVMNSSPWNLDMMEDAILEDCYINSGKAEKIDVITENGILDENEVILGLKTGVLNFDAPEFITYFKIVKDLVPYYNVGFNSASWEYESLFNDGKSAMTLNGSWYPNQHMINKTPVNYGIALIPYVDSSIYANARNKPVKYAATAPQGDIVVTQKAVDEGRGDAAVKFLQYLSNANDGGKFWVEKTMFLPVIKNVELPEIMKQFDELRGDTKRTYFAAKMLHFDSELYTAYRKIFSEYLENDQTAEEFAHQVQKLYKDSLDEAIELIPIDINSYVDKVK